MNDLAVPGFFTWSNGHMVTFTYWDLGEPTNHDGFNEDCVKMSYQVREEKIDTLKCIQNEGKKQKHIYMFVVSLLQTGRWNDVYCTELNTFVCKMAKAHYPLPSVQPTVYGCPQVGKTCDNTDAYIWTHSWCLPRLSCVRAGMHTNTPVTGWRRRPGAGRMPKTSVKGRTASWCTSETCEQQWRHKTCLTS